MSTNTQPAGDPAAVATASAAVRYLAEHGFETTTASDLADAIGMSRSTFFRRFGSKEDVIFADHDVALARLEKLLQQDNLNAEAALTRGASEVMHQLIRDSDAARARSELLRQSPALRERELVITHRYERVFGAYLQRVAAPGTPAWAPTALAAGLVAVHNATLRRWLRGADPREFAGLERELRELIGRFAPWFGGEDRASRVVVATFEATASPDQVLREIRAQLS